MKKPRAGDRVRVHFPDAPLAPPVDGVAVSVDLLPGVVVVRLDRTNADLGLPWNAERRTIVADTPNVEVLG